MSAGITPGPEEAKVIVRCVWHKPIPIYLREKPPFEDRRVTDGMCEECMKKMFKEAGVKMKACQGEVRDFENKLDL